MGTPSNLDKLEIKFVDSTGELGVARHLAMWRQAISSQDEPVVNERWLIVSRKEPEKVLAILESPPLALSADSDFDLLVKHVRNLYQVSSPIDVENYEEGLVSVSFRYDLGENSGE